MTDRLIETCKTISVRDMHDTVLEERHRAVIDVRSLFTRIEENHAHRFGVLQNPHAFDRALNGACGRRVGVFLFFRDFVSEAKKVFPIRHS